MRGGPERDRGLAVYKRARRDMGFLQSHDVARGSLGVALVS
jgi:hypothetical protein